MLGVCVVLMYTYASFYTTEIQKTKPTFGGRAPQIPGPPMPPSR